MIKALNQYYLQSSSGTLMLLNIGLYLVNCSYEAEQTR